MKASYFIFGVILFIGFSFENSYGQAEFGFDDKDAFSPHSMRPIRKADVMYNNSVWIRMDLREKQNEPFFATNSEITKIIIDAVKAGVLRPYKNDSLVTRMSIQEFNDNIKIPGADEGLADDDLASGFGGDDWGSGGDDWGSGDDWGDEGGTEEDAGPDEFFAKDIYVIELKEHRLFDRKRSRMYYDIQSIKLIIPGELYPTGIDKELATFSYKELVSNVFLDNPAAVWYNAKNTAENKNLADAFELRQFTGKIVKYSNPKDNVIDDIYKGNLKLGLAKSQEYEHRLLEYESDLWSN
ncbi:gliding motility protein GldN [Flexithrix dorotheae]|uniref:type IX secretion system ring protein PorN/GldN n=1 Tax=Flexithrix dorotheae TaxID=70993 RepID=UPI0003691703|nr:gliding motility protein GldN [Flexithrix dorotheae]